MRWPQPPTIDDQKEKELFNSAIREVKNVTIESDFELANVLETWKNSYPWKPPINARRYGAAIQIVVASTTIGFRQFYYKFTGEIFSSLQFSLTDRTNEIFYGNAIIALIETGSLGNPTDIILNYSSTPTESFPSNNFFNLLYSAGSFGATPQPFPSYFNQGNMPRVPIVGFSLQFNQALASNVSYVLNINLDGYVITTN